LDAMHEPEICPVRSERLYHHVRMYARNRMGTEDLAQVAGVVSAAMAVVRKINDQDGTLRVVYQTCVASDVYGVPYPRAFFSVEEACVESIVVAGVAK
jgi:hypothetical protein